MSGTLGGALSTAAGPCPCGGVPAGAALADCCGRYLSGEVWPTEAEALMRSRYTAYATDNPDHVFRTWHAATRPDDVSVDPSIRWTGLDVLGSGGDETEAWVDFAAHWLAGEGAARQRGAIREHARFVRRAGRWVYRDGSTLDG